MSDLATAACLESHRGGYASSRASAVDEVVDMAKAASLAFLESEEERQLARVLAESKATMQPALQSEEERQLARVLAESRAIQQHGDPIVESKLLHYHEEP